MLDGKKLNCISYTHIEETIFGRSDVTLESESHIHSRDSPRLSSPNIASPPTSRFLILTVKPSSSDRKFKSRRAAERAEKGEGEKIATQKKGKYWLIVNVVYCIFCRNIFLVTNNKFHFNSSLKFRYAEKGQINLEKISELYFTLILIGTRKTHCLLRISELYFRSLESYKIFWSNFL